MVHKMQRLALINSSNMEVDGHKCATIEEEPEVEVVNAAVQQGTLAWVTGCFSPNNCVMSVFLFDLVFKCNDVLSSTVQINPILFVYSKVFFYGFFYPYITGGPMSWFFLWIIFSFTAVFFWSQDLIQNFITFSFLLSNNISIGYSSLIQVVGGQ